MESHKPPLKEMYQGVQTLTQSATWGYRDYDISMKGIYNGHTEKEMVNLVWEVEVGSQEIFIENST